MLREARTSTYYIKNLKIPFLKMRSYLTRENQNTLLRNCHLYCKNWSALLYKWLTIQQTTKNAKPSIPLFFFFKKKQFHVHFSWSQL
jgi:hypothetical protein